MGRRHSDGIHFGSCHSSDRQSQGPAVSTYHAIPADDRACLESAERMLQMDRAEMTVTDIVLMVYNLGRISGRVDALKRTDPILRELSEFLDPLVDVSDGNDGAPQANKAMSLKAEVDGMIERRTHSNE